MESRELMVGLAEAAATLRIPYHEAHRLLLLGGLRGSKMRGRWMVRVGDVERLAKGEVKLPRAVTG